MAHLKHRFKIVCDLETSGDDPIRNGVISATFLIIDEYKNVIDEFSRKVRPPELSPSTWSLGAERVHKKSISEVMTYMPNDQFCYELLCFLGKYKHPENWPMPFICHASPKGAPKFKPNTRKPDGSYMIQPWFDYTFLSWAFRKAFFQNGQSMIWSFYKVINPNALISTVKMGRDAGYQGNKLNHWAKRLGFNLNHHDDRSDTYCCLEVYKYLTKEI